MVYPNPVALVFDTIYGRPDVMFVIQRCLESDGKFIFIRYKNKVLEQHDFFRIFTINTVGLGDTSKLGSRTNKLIKVR